MMKLTSIMKKGLIILIVGIFLFALFSFIGLHFFNKNGNNIFASTVFNVQNNENIMNNSESNENNIQNPSDNGDTTIGDSQEEVTEGKKDDKVLTEEELIKKNIDIFFTQILPVLIILGITIIILLIITFVFSKVKKHFLKKLSVDKTKDTIIAQQNITSIINLINTVLRFGVLLAAILLSLKILDIIKFDINLTEILNWFLTNGIAIIVTIIAIIIFLKLVSVILERIKVSLLSKYEKDKTIKTIDKLKKAETLTKLTGYIFRLIIWVTGIIMILGKLEINLTPLLAGAGIVGIAIGLGAQNLIKDIIQGAFILIENQYHVGDVVSISGVAGLVEEFNIRYTRLRNLSGSVFFIPNGEISVVENMTKEWSRALVDIGIAYKENVDYVMTVISEVGKELENDENYRNIILSPMEILGIQELGDSSVTIRTLIKTLPLNQWQVARELKRRIKNTFDEKGIEIPFPHITVAIGDEAGKGNINVMLKHFEQETGKRVKKENIKNKEKNEHEDKAIDSTSVYGSDHSDSGSSDGETGGK